MDANIKIAIVCDWLVTLGGAEKVLEALLRCFPQADLFAVVDFLDEEQRAFLGNKKITNTFIQKLPFAASKYRHYLPLMPLAVEQLDLSSYHIILSSSHAVAKGVLTGPDQLHICYIHTPMRYAWDLQHQYLQESGLHKKWYGWLARYMLHKLRLWDLRSANGVDHFVANSNYIARRVQKTYRRDADVIYPPVNTSIFSPGKDKKSFYLTASRLVPYKRVDLIVDAFNNLPNQQLIVIGDGPEMGKIRAKAGSNVTLLGHQSNEALLAYLQQAQAFIFAAEEDFGILPLEAQASGTPVIAYGKGGALETIRGLQDDHPTGVFFSEQSTQGIAAGIHAFEKMDHLITTNNCVNNATRFAPEHFQQAITAYVQQKWRAYNEGILPLIT